MKKIFSFMLIAAGLMVSAQSFAEKDWKFYFGVKSGSEIKATVYDDYYFDVQLPTSGFMVDPAQATFSAGMQNVATLGVTTKREHSTTVQTGAASQQVDLTTWLGNAFSFQGATLNGSVIANGETKPFTYVIAGKNANGVIAATTNTEETRAAWHKLAAQVTPTMQTPDDSHLKVAEGSYLKYGNQQLDFDADVELFKGQWQMSDMLDRIANNTTLKTLNLTGEETFKAILSIEKGSILAIGGSLATFDYSCKITLDCSNAYVATDKTGALTALDNAVRTKNAANLIKGIMDLVNGLVGDIDAAETVAVTVEIDNPWAVIRGENSLMVGDNDHALAIGEIGTFVVKQAVSQVRGGVVYDVNERVGAVGAATSLELVEAEFPLVAGRPYIFKASADKLEGILSGAEVSTAGDFNGLIGKYEYFTVPATDGSTIYNFMIYENEAKLCGQGCYIYGGLAYINMNDVPQQGQGPAAPGRARFIMGGKGATTGLLEGNMIVPAQGMEKMMVGGQLIIVKDGKMFNAQGAAL